MNEGRKKANQAYQHEPAVPPTGWYGDERRYAIKIGQLFDDLYNKYGALLKRVEKLEDKDNA